MQVLWEEKKGEARHVAALIAAEKERQGALLREEAVLAGMATYQADALQVLTLGALGERLEGEVELVGDQPWQQLTTVQAGQPGPTAGMYSSTAQHSAEHTSASSSGSGSDGRAAQQGAAPSGQGSDASGGATPGSAEAASSGGAAASPASASGAEAKPASGLVQRLIGDSVLDALWYSIAQAPSWASR